jgi:hypothetical protein
VTESVGSNVADGMLFFIKPFRLVDYGLAYWDVSLGCTLCKHPVTMRTLGCTVHAAPCQDVTMSFWVIMKTRYLVCLETRIYLC